MADEQALTTAYEQHVARVLGAALGAAESEPDLHDDNARSAWANDVTQAVFVRAWRERSADSELGLPQLLACLRHELFERRASFEALRRELDALTPQQGQLVVAVALDGDSVDDAATRAGIGRDEGATALHDGLVRLRDRWEADHAAL